MYFNNLHIELCLEGPDSLFRNLNNKEKEVLIQHLTFKQYNKGELLFNEGDKPDGLICLATGKVKVFKVGVGGREQILRLIKPHDFLGYRALFSETRLSVSAVALEDSSTCEFEKETFLRIIKKNNELAFRFMKVLADDLGFSNSRTASLTQKHIRGRLAESLIILRDTYGFENDGKTLGVYLSREDIAHLSNMTTSNAIRTLSTFASEEVIGLDGRKILIIDSSRLEKISELG
jgi:CRP/FNR family transcriptional regulator, polysaccharide utilization system transcription regulator